MLTDRQLQKVVRMMQDMQKGKMPKTVSDILLIIKAYDESVESIEGEDDGE